MIELSKDGKNLVDKKWESIDDVHSHALKMVGNQINTLVSNETTKKYYKNPKNKGWIGNSIESDWFGLANNSRHEADFSSIGLELKVTPIKKVNSGKNNEKWVAKERLVLGIFDFNDEYKRSFESASFLQKAKATELIYYEYDSKKIYLYSGKEYADYPSFSIKAATLFKLNSLPEEDLEIIRQDWEAIVAKIKEGKAHELSDSLTRYLAATTKGSKSERNMTSQPFSDLKAHRRAFTLKGTYMSTIAQKVMGGTFEKAISNVNLLKIKTFEEIIIDLYKPFIGKTKKELADIFNINIPIKNDKASSPLLAKKMLNLNGSIEDTEEFQKAGIKVKNISVERNKSGNLSKKTTEAFKLQNYFDFSEVSKIDFEESKLYNYLSTSRFLFVIWEETKQGAIFKGVKFWSMPYEELTGNIKECYNVTQKTLQNGLKLTYKTLNKPTITGKLYVVENNLPGIKSRLSLHVRPDARYSQYCGPFHRWNGKFKNDGSQKIEFLNSAMQLPVRSKWINRPEDKLGKNIDPKLHDKLEDKWMTKQAFWLNSDYMFEQVEEYFK